MQLRKVERRPKGRLKEMKKAEIIELLRAKAEVAEINSRNEALNKADRKEAEGKMMAYVVALVLLEQMED